MLGRLFDELAGAFEELDSLALSCSELETLLWSFTYKNRGSQGFYQRLCAALLGHQGLSELSYAQLAKLASLFYRAPNARVGGKDFLSFAEKTIWAAAQDRLIRTIEELVDVVYYVIPKNIGSNKFRVLLEVYLYNMLKSPSTVIATKKIIRILNAYSQFRFTYEPLNETLKELVSANLALFKVDELTRIVWSFSRFKDCPDQFLVRIIDKYKSVLEQQSDFSYRDFSFIINSALNAGIQHKELWEYFNATALKITQKGYVSEHYLIKILAILIYKGDFWELAHSVRTELMKEHRMPPHHGQDLARLLLLTAENPVLQCPEFLAHLEEKAFSNVNFLHTESIAQILYSLARLNQYSEEVFVLLEKRLLESDLAATASLPLALASFALVENNRTALVEKSVFHIIQSMFESQNKSYIVDNSSDEEDALVLKNEETVNLNAEVPACSVILMCWVASVVGLRDNTFWSDKLWDSLHAIALTQHHFTQNKWAAAARVEQQDEDFILRADTFHYVLLMQTLGLMGQDLGAKPEALRGGQCSATDWLDSMSEPYNEVQPCLGFAEKLEIAGNIVLFYRKEDYISGNQLKTTRKVERDLYVKMGLKVLEIPPDIWTRSDDIERLRLIKG